MIPIDESNKIMGDLVEEAIFFGKTGSRSKNSILRKLKKNTENHLTNGGRFPLRDDLKIEVNDAHGISGMLGLGQKASLKILDEIDGVSLELVINTDGDWRIFNTGQVVASGKTPNEQEIQNSWKNELLKKY